MPKLNVITLYLTALEYFRVPCGTLLSRNLASDPRLVPQLVPGTPVSTTQGLLPIQA